MVLLFNNRNEKSNTFFYDVRKLAFNYDYFQNFFEIRIPMDTQE